MSADIKARILNKQWLDLITPSNKTPSYKVACGEELVMAPDFPCRQFCLEQVRYIYLNLTSSIFREKHVVSTYYCCTPN